MLGLVPSEKYMEVRITSGMDFDCVIMISCDDGASLLMGHISCRLLQFLSISPQRLTALVWFAEFYQLKMSCVGNGHYLGLLLKMEELAVCLQLLDYRSDLFYKLHYKLCQH